MVLSAWPLCLTALPLQSTSQAPTPSKVWSNVSCPEASDTIEKSKGIVNKSQTGTSAGQVIRDLALSTAMSQNKC